MATKAEVLQLAGTLREKLGVQAAREFPISKNWGRFTTTAALLVRDPAWQRDLTDDIIEGVYAEIRSWLKRYDKASEEHQRGV